MGLSRIPGVSLLLPRGKGRPWRQGETGPGRGVSGSSVDQEDGEEEEREAEAGADDGREDKDGKEAVARRASTL